MKGKLHIKSDDIQTRTTVEGNVEDILHLWGSLTWYISDTTGIPLKTLVGVLPSLLDVCRVVEEAESEEEADDSADDGDQLDHVLRALAQDNLRCEENGIQRAGFNVCGTAIAALTALLDASIKDLELVDGRKTEQTASSVKLAVVCVGADLVQCIGVFDGWFEAYGHALEYASTAAKDYEHPYRITSLEALEGDTGECLLLETEDGKKTDETVYILRVQS